MREEFIKTCLQNGVKNFYHLTKLKNLASIRRYGLLSQRELYARKIAFNNTTNTLSKDLDKKRGLDDYVRLSFGEFSPLFSRFLQRYLNENYIIFNISLQILNDISCIKFSNINATDNNSIIFDDIKKF